MPVLDQASIEQFAVQYLVEVGTLPENAVPVARAVAQAEAEGNVVCGLFYLLQFKEQIEVKKVDAEARPEITQNEGSSIVVDAHFGFAHPAIELANEALISATRSCGVAAAAVKNSYNCLSLAHHVLPLANAGLIGFCCSNAPANVAAPGGTRPIFGTNPMAFAVPGLDGPSIVIDQSASAVTKTQLILHMERGEPIPTGWAQDTSGQDTTDPAIGLAGSMLPYGGQKGANIGLIVEVLAAVLTGSNLSVDASSFSGSDGDVPGVGQFLLAIDPARFSGRAFSEKLEALSAVFNDDGLRFPGQRYRGARLPPEEVMVTVDDDLWTKLNARS